jgi:hypothetical protein
LETLFVKKKELGLDKASWYSVDGYKPVIIFEYTLSNQGKYSRRTAYDFYNLIGDVGGL